MIKLRQRLCKHKYDLIAKHQHTQSNLWKCKKCDVYYIQHYGINVGYLCRIPNVGGWIRPEEDGT